MAARRKNFRATQMVVNEQVLAPQQGPLSDEKLIDQFFKNPPIRS